MVTDPNPYTYRGTVTNVHDGDTLTIAIDLGFRITYENAVRLFGVNAPELGTGPGDQALAFIKTLVTGGDQVTVKTHRPGTNAGGDKYGRWLAEVTLSDGRDLARTMIDAGHAVTYLL